jgi:hypothetical protein
MGETPGDPPPGRRWLSHKLSEAATSPLQLGKQIEREIRDVDREAEWTVEYLISPKTTVLLLASSFVGTEYHRHRVRAGECAERQL